MGNPFVIYEDKQVLALYKPAGWLSQPDGSDRPQLLGWGKEYLKARWSKPGDAFLAPCHRLDRPASGVLCWAKTSKAAGRISGQFRDKEVRKAYLCLCHGKIDGLRGSVGANLTRVDGVTRIVKAPKGRPARLDWSLLANEGALSLLRVAVDTGIRHQIRAILADLWHPILGDFLYGGDPGPFGTDAIGLHCQSLGLSHPVTKEPMSLSCNPEPEWPWSQMPQGCWDAL
ncbi:MAG: RluA family pseudouridine synthase [Deltaproteobacteria bacterium]|jgi:23S rRNA pseudouridine1911/1915/1917 synthase|nr:RluA family pseudouridine synthase [Deltaproteobacteria bacterium]